MRRCGGGAYRPALRTFGAVLKGSWHGAGATGSGRDSTPAPELRQGKEKAGRASSLEAALRHARALGTGPEAV